MSINYYRDVKDDPFYEIRQEEDYKQFYYRFHEWNKNNILDLQIALVESLQYFKGLPQSNLGLNSFIELFNLHNKPFFIINSKSYHYLDEIIMGPDRQSKCLQINFSTKNPYTRIISISDLDKI